MSTFRGFINFVGVFSNRPLGGVMSEWAVLEFVFVAKS